MNGIHDLGGKHGFGPVKVEADEPVFHERWEGRVLGMRIVGGFLFEGSIDAARHAVERIAPEDYLAVGYYGRWLRALETQLLEAGYVSRGEVEARMTGQAFESGPVPTPPTLGDGDGRRPRDREPAFSIGQRVRTRNINVPGHNRLPGYARTHRGTVAMIHPDAWVLPDARAHGLGDNPEVLYAVRFPGQELWGEQSEPGSSVTVDLWESYLESED